MFHFKCENNKKEKKGRQSKNKAEIPKENKAPEFQPFFFVLVCNLICSISQIAPAQLTPIGPTHGQKGEGPSEPWRKITLKNPAYKGQENRKIERKLL